MSNAADQAIAAAGKGSTPKGFFAANRNCPGTVQNMHRTVIRKDGVLPGKTQLFYPAPPGAGFCY